MPLDPGKNEFDIGEGTKIGTEDDIIRLITSSEQWTT